MVFFKQPGLRTEYISNPLIHMQNYSVCTLAASLHRIVDEYMAGDKIIRHRSFYGFEISSLRFMYLRANMISAIMVVMITTTIRRSTK